MAIFTITVNANNAPVVNISWSDDTTNNKFGSDASSPAKLVTVVDASSILNYTWQSSIDNGVTYTSLSTTTSATVYNENLVENDTTIIRLKVEDEYGLIGYSNLLQYEHTQAIILDPFDYIILTYQYTPPENGDYDLDTISAFRYGNGSLSGTFSNDITGMIPGTLPLGCGCAGGDSRDSVTPSGVSINDAFMRYGGDDVNQGVGSVFGESLVINFKNLELSNITTQPDIVVDLYAGWQSFALNGITIPITSHPIEVKYQTFNKTLNSTVNLISGTNKFETNGTPVLVNPIISTPPITILQGRCIVGVTGSGAKKKVGSIYYNLVTKNSSIEFFN